jgi:hypothetical protein
MTHFNLSLNRFLLFALFALALLFFASCKPIEKTLLAAAVKTGKVGSEITVEEAKTLKSNFDIIKKERIKEPFFPAFIEFPFNSRLIQFFSNTTQKDEFVRISNAISKDNRQTVIFEKININTTRIDTLTLLAGESFTEAIRRYKTGSFLTSGTFSRPFITSEIFSTKLIFEYLLENGKNQDIKSLRVYYGLKDNIVRFILTRADANYKDGLTYIGAGNNSSAIQQKQKGGANNDLPPVEPKDVEVGCCHQ